MLPKVPYIINWTKSMDWILESCHYCHCKSFWFFFFEVCCFYNINWFNKYSLLCDEILKYFMDLLVLAVNLITTTLVEIAFQILMPACPNWRNCKFILWSLVCKYVNCTMSGAEVLGIFVISCTTELQLNIGKEFKFKMLGMFRSTNLR